MANQINIPAQIDIVKVNGIEKVSTALGVSPGLTRSIVELDRVLGSVALSAKTLKSSLNFSDTVKSNLFGSATGDINKAVTAIENIDKALKKFQTSPKASTFANLKSAFADVIKDADELKKALSGAVQGAADARITQIRTKEKQAIKERTDFELSQIRALETARSKAADANKRNEFRQTIGGLQKENQDFANNRNVSGSRSRIADAKGNLESFLNRVNEDRQIQSKIDKLVRDNEDFISKRNAAKTAARVGDAKGNLQGFGFRNNDVVAAESERQRRVAAINRAAEQDNNKSASAGAKERNTTIGEFLDRSKGIEQAQKRSTNEAGKLTKELQNHVLSAGKFGEAIALSFKRFAAFLGPSAVLLGITFAIRNAIKESLEFEKILTRISQVAGKPRTDFNPLGQQFVDLSRSTGVSSLEVGKGILTLAQAGFNRPEELSATAEKLIKVPLAPTFDDIGTTLDGLLAIFGQFNKTLTDTGEIFDVVNQFSADFAIESKDIFEIVKRGGATFSVAGGSFKEFLRLSSTLRETTRQTPETIGTFFKTATAELISPKSQQILRGLNVGPGDITSQLTQLADVFAERFGKKIEGPEAVGLASELVGNRQLDKLLGLLRGLNNKGLQSRLDNSLASATGSFDKSAQKRIEDIGQSLDRIKESFSGLFKIAANNQSLREFTKLIADMAQGMSILTQSLAKNIPQFIALGSVLASPFLKEVFLGAKGRLFGLQGKQLTKFLDASETSIRASLSESSIDPKEKETIIAQRRSELAAQNAPRNSRRSVISRVGGIATLGLVGAAALSASDSNVGRSASSGLTGGIIASSLGLGPLGAAFIGLTIATNSLIKGFEEARNAAIGKANNFGDLSKVVGDKSIGNRLVDFKNAVIDQLSSFSDPDQFDLQGRAFGGDKSAIKKLFLQDIRGDTNPLSNQVNALTNTEIGNILKESKPDFTNRETSQKLFGNLVANLLKNPDFISLLKEKGIDTNDPSAVNEVVGASLRRSSNFKSAGDLKSQTKLAESNAVESEINKVANAAFKLQNSSLDSIRKLTEGLDKLSSVITNPFELITARLVQDPIEALKGLSGGQLKKLDIEPDALNGLLDSRDKFLNTYLKDISSFLGDDKLLNKENTKSLGQLRSDLLRDLINEQGTTKNAAARTAQAAAPTEDTGARRVLLSESLEKNETAKSLGFFNKDGSKSGFLEAANFLQLFKGLQSGAQAADVVLNQLKAITTEFLELPNELRDRQQRITDILNKRLELEQQVSDGMRETNNQLFEFGRQIKDLSLGGVERGIGFNADINRTNPTIVDLQTVAALKGSLGSSFGGVGSFATTARNAANQFGTDRDLAQQARINSKTEPEPFLKAQQSLGKFLDVQSELNQRLTESGSKVSTLSRVTDILKGAFERLRSGVEGVGQQLFGTSQNDFAAGLFSIQNFVKALGTGDFSKATVDNVGDALNGLNDFTIDNLTKFLGLFQNINLGGGVTGGDLLTKIQTSVAIPGIATARAAVNGTSVEIEIKKLTEELAASEVAARQALEEEKAARGEQIVLVQLQQELAAQNIGFFQKQSESIQALAQYFNTDSQTIIADNTTKIAQEVSNIASKLNEQNTNSSTYSSNIGFPGYTPRFADGGLVSGGIGGVDSVSILAMPDEFVVNSRASKKNRKLLEHINSGGSLDSIRNKYSPRSHGLEYDVTKSLSNLNYQTPITRSSGFGEINQSVPEQRASERDFGPSRKELIQGRNRQNEYNTYFNNLSGRYGGNTKNSEFIRHANRLNQKYGKDAISNKDDLDRYIANRSATNAQESQARISINKDSATQSSTGDIFGSTMIPKFDELININKQMLDKLSASEKGVTPKFELSISPIAVSVNLTAPDILKLAGNDLYKSVVAAMKPKLIAAFRATGNQESVSQVEGL